MKIKIIIVSLILFFGLHHQKIYAQEKSVFIDTISPYQNIVVGQTIPINVGVTSVTPNTTYKYFFYGGIAPDDYISVQTIGTDNSIINISNITLNFNKLPTFISDSSGNNYFTDYHAFIGPDQPSGRYYVYVALLPPDNSSVDNLVSDFYQIYVLPNPNPTIPISPTILTPTDKLSPTPILNISPTPTSPINLLSPSSSYHPIPTLTPFPTINPHIYGTISTISASITPKNLLKLIPTNYSQQVQIGATNSDITPSPVITTKSTPTSSKNLIFLILLMSGFLILSFLPFFEKTKSLKTIFVLVSFTIFFTKPTFALEEETLYVQVNTPIEALSSLPVISPHPVFQNSSKNRQPSALKTKVNPVYEASETIKIELYNDDLNYVNTTIVDANNQPVATEINQLDQNGITTISIIPPPQLKPGKYTVKIVDQVGSNIQQNFLWGVLAINTNKSTYIPNETAALSFSVLNDAGSVVCDANLTLKITAPDGKVSELSTANNQITINKSTCSSTDLTIKPDYESNFLVEFVGIYKLELTAITSNGIYNIIDYFTVEPFVSFDIERNTATRIYPFNIYPVNINIIANQDFQGSIYESIPDSFDIIKPANAPEFSFNNSKIKWSVNLKKGDVIKLQYQYKAPNISPQFYLVGPLTFSNLTDLIYQETRSWQIAADATSVSYTSNSNFIVPDGVSSLIVEAWGGGGAGGGGGASNKNGGGGGAGGQYSKKTLTVSAGTTYPVVIGIGGSTVTTKIDGPAGGDTIFGNNLVIAKGGAGGKSFASGGAGGIGSTVSGIGDTIYQGGSGAAGSSTYSGGGGGAAGSLGAGGNASGITAGVGTSAFGGNGAAGRSGNSYTGLKGSNYGGAGSGATKNGVPGSGADGYMVITYTVVANQPPNTPTNISPGTGTTAVDINPTLTASSFSDPDVSDTHANSEWQIATDSGFTSIIWASGITSTNKISTIINSTNGTFQGSLNGKTSLGYLTQYYWRVRYQDNKNNWSNYSSFFSFTTKPAPSIAPDIPNLIYPPTSSTGLGQTPTFKTVTTDSNGDYVQYELKICTDSSMSTNCQTLSQPANNIGWSGQDVGTSAYSSGTTATYVIQSNNPLIENTTYYWKTRAIDPVGTNTWSSTQSTPFSFTINGRPRVPTLIFPGTGSTAVSQTPSLTTVTTDINNDLLQYKIELATDNNFTQNLQIFDLSISSIGWSGIDVGTSAYSSGTTATYVIQVGSSLAPSTTYYWRSYAKDPSGTNLWSPTQGTVFSFTTIGNNLKQASFRWSADDGGESRGVGDTWFNSNYGYRKPVTITNNIAVDLSDYQTKILFNTSELITAGKMRSDCNDIRITDTDKQTLLNYYIESGCNTTSTIIWVKIPSLSASTVKNIYLYYGYSSAVSVSNGDNTFNIFDDFNGTNIDTNKWHDWNPYSWGTVNVSGGTLAITGGTTGGSVWAKGIISNNQFSFSDHIIETKSKWVMSGAINTNGYYQKTGIRIGDSYPSTILADNNYNFAYVRYNGLFNIELHYYEFNKTVSGTNSKVAESSSTNNDNLANFEIQKYDLYSGPNQKGSKSIDNGSSFSSLWTAADSLTLSNYYGISIEAKQGSDGSVTQLVDWFRIRKYATVEPSVSIGTESTPPPPDLGATWLAAENIGVTNVATNTNIRLRFSVANIGINSSASFRLQIAPKGVVSNCGDVLPTNFVDVDSTTTTNPAIMSSSSYFINLSPTTRQLTPSASTFISGHIIEYPSNQSNSVSLITGQFTEVEYNFQMTTNSGSNTTYCFRLTNGSNPLNTYTNLAQLTTAYSETNYPPGKPYLPYVNNDTAQSGQQSPVYGLIDHTPAFSAVFDDPNILNTASAYQIQIGSDLDWTSSEIWDSGKNPLTNTCSEGSRCHDIIYSGGNNLVDGSTYYWRLKFWDNLDVGGSWSDTQQFSMNSSPIVSNIVINNNNNINLTENSSIGISWTATVTDADGYTDLSLANGKLYRSGVGSSCSLDNNNCYTDTSCDFYNCSSNICNLKCDSNIFFFAEPTDAGVYVSQFWQALVQVTDIRGEIGTTVSSSTSIDVNTLTAFNIGSSIVYGQVFAGSNTGSSNVITTITNTGNSLINLELTGDFMCTDYPSCGGQSINPNYQQYQMNTFTYGSGTTLTSSPTVVSIGISKPTQSPSNSSKNLYWGIGIPDSKEPGNYHGSTTILVAN